MDIQLTIAKIPLFIRRDKNNDGLRKTWSWIETWKGNLSLGKFVEISTSIFNLGDTCVSFQT